MMLAATVVAYAGGLAIETLRGRPKACKVAFVLTVCLVTANLLVFKYANFLWDTLNSIVSTGVTLPTIALPIGISFYTFQILSYVIDLYWGKVHVQRNFFYLLLYVSFFPQLIAGPIVRYSTIEDEILHLGRRGSGPEALPLGPGKESAHRQQRCRPRGHDLPGQPEHLRHGPLLAGVRGLHDANLL